MQLYAHFIRHDHSRSLILNAAKCSLLYEWSHVYSIMQPLDSLNQSPIVLNACLRDGERYVVRCSFAPTRVLFPTAKV